MNEKDYPKNNAGTTNQNIAVQDISILESISQKGVLFSILFYLLLALYSLEIIALFFINTFLPGFFFLIVPLILVGIILFLILKRKLYGTLLAFLILSPFSLVIIPLIANFIGGSGIFLYVLVSIYALINGLIAAYMFDKASKDLGSYLRSGIALSSVIALVFAISSAMSLVLSKLASVIAENPDSNMISFFSPSGYNDYICFVLAFVFLNLPYLIFYLRRKDINAKIFWYYLIPIAIFLVFSFTLRYLAETITTL